MTSPSETTSPTSVSTQIGAFKAYLPVWIAMSITAGLTLGTVATGMFRWLHLFSAWIPAALATVVGVLVEIPVMPSLVSIANRLRQPFDSRALVAT